MMRKEKIGFYSIGVNVLLVAIKGVLMVATVITFAFSRYGLRQGKIIGSLSDAKHI